MEQGTTHNDIGFDTPVVDLRLLRDTLSLSVARLAQLLEVSPSTVYGWENGRRRPSVEQLIRLGDKLNLAHGVLGQIVRSFDCDEHGNLKEWHQVEPTTRGMQLMVDKRGLLNFRFIEDA